MAAPRLRHIYIIEIVPPWVEIVAGSHARPGRRCFYVGESWHDAEHRARQHCTSRGYDVAKVFKDIRRAKSSTGNWRDAALVRGTDVWLRTKLFQNLPGYETVDESEAHEARIVDQLRRQGHLVYPENMGNEPFD